MYKFFYKILTAILAVILLSFTQVKAQQGLEIGANAGVSYYMGDINLARPFYSPHTNLGGFVKYHFNPRNIIKLGAFSTKLSADDADFKSQFQQMRNASFKTSFTEINLCYEVNFLPFMVGQIKKSKFSPYLSVGAGMFIAPETQKKIGFALPMSLGIKRNISKHFIIGGEIAFHWLATDLIDNLTGEDINENYSENYGQVIHENEIEKQRGFRYNNDWHVSATITLSYSFRIGGLTCYAY